MFEAKLLPIHAWKGSAIYNDFLLPADSPWFLAFWLHKSPESAVTLSIQGSRGRGPFNERDGACIKPLLSHVRRSLEIKDRLEVAQVHQNTLAATVEHMSSGVVLLDERGRIVEANSLAQKFLRTGTCLRRKSDGSLWLREPAGSLFSQWVCSGRPPDNYTDSLLHIPRPAAAPLSILVANVPRGEFAWIHGTAPSWIVLIFDPDQRAFASVEMLACDLGLSERESEVVALLVVGYDMAFISKRLNISVHTSRSHLKSVFAKTGARSQNQLLARVLLGPAGIRAPGRT
jgi:DNA-binding CsgD family transcriptional regulator/PAS domain-containing protein